MTDHLDLTIEVARDLKETLVRDHGGPVDLCAYAVFHRDGTRVASVQGIDSGASPGMIASGIVGFAADAVIVVADQVFAVRPEVPSAGELAAERADDPNSDVRECVSIIEIPRHGLTRLRVFPYEYAEGEPGAPPQVRWLDEYAGDFDEEEVASILVGSARGAWLLAEDEAVVELLSAGSGSARDAATVRVLRAEGYLVLYEVG